MKTKNIKYTAQAVYSDGTIKTRLFCSEKAKSNWANAQYRKDEDVTVYVYDGLTDTLVETWHA